MAISGCGSKSASRQALPCRQQYELARQKFEKKKYRDAVEELKLLFFNCPGSPMIDTAQYFLAVCYFNQEDYPTAAGEFRKLLSSFPTSDFADDALFMLGLSDFKQSPQADLDQTYTYQALEHFQDFLDIYPASLLLPEVEKYIQACRDKLAEKDFKNGRTYLRLKYFEAARTYFQEVLERYPQSKWAAQAQFLIAESYRLTNQRGEALAEYQKVVENYADSQFSRKSRQRIEELRGKEPQQN
jgi:outer membrane protein assembly factor BamD